MIEQFLPYYESVTYFALVLSVFFVCFTENIFPPFPGDVLMALGAAFCIDRFNQWEFFYLSSVAGSLFGFFILYILGKNAGERILNSKIFFFIRYEDVAKFKTLFSKYGSPIIIIHRFFPGIRSIVGFVTGLYEINLSKSLILGMLSTFVWNGVVIYLGIIIGKNQHRLEDLFRTYGQGVMTLFGILFVVYLVWKLYHYKQDENKNS